MPDKHCETCTCGEPKPTPRSAGGPTTPRVVKPGHIFMGANGGQPVLVPNEHLETKPTLLATYSVEEWKAKVDAARRPVEEPKTNSVELAKEFQKRAAANAERDKKRAAADAEKAER